MDTASKRTISSAPSGCAAAFGLVDMEAEIGDLG